MRQFVFLLAIYLPAVYTTNAQQQSTVEESWTWGRNMAYGVGLKLSDDFADPPTVLGVLPGAKIDGSIGSGDVIISVDGMPIPTLRKFRAVSAVNWCSGPEKVTLSVRKITGDVYTISTTPVLEVKLQGHDWSVINHAIKPILGLLQRCAELMIFTPDKGFSNHKVSVVDNNIAVFDANGDLERIFSLISDGKSALLETYVDIKDLKNDAEGLSEFDFYLDQVGATLPYWEEYHELSGSIPGKVTVRSPTFKSNYGFREHFKNVFAATLEYENEIRTAILEDTNCMMRTGQEAGSCPPIQLQGKTYSKMNPNEAAKASNSGIILFKGKFVFGLEEVADQLLKLGIPTKIVLEDPINPSYIIVPPYKFIAVINGQVAESFSQKDINKKAFETILNAAVKAGYPK